MEINALWYNALVILAALEVRFGDPLAASDLRARAARVQKRFVELFWNDVEGYLYDVVDGEQRDSSLRPNQIFALSLPFPLLTGERAASVLRAVERHLLTPYGLRTLAPGDPRYRGRYAGDVPSRDGAYHQGTVWPWLLGPYLSALVRVRGEEGRDEGRRLIVRFTAHLADAGIGSVSEVFDGDAPHAPGGCPAQAWSVAEILRAAIEDLGLLVAEHRPAPNSRGTRGRRAPRRAAAP